MSNPQQGDAAQRDAGLVVRDALTGVYARVALLERLDEEVHRGKRYGDAFSILLLDLDHFKSINDAFGHARGDAVLTEFVERVQRAARNSDVLFRYGGDEFVLFLPRTTHEQAAVLGSRLVEQVCGASFPGHPPLSLTVSVGVASLPGDGNDARELLARADARMYAAKREGRGRVVSVDLSSGAELLLDENARLVERLDAVDRANRFFDALHTAQSGILTVRGEPGAGRSRLLREIERLAALRGHSVISLAGRPDRGLEHLGALRVALAAAAQLPDALWNPADVAAALQSTLASTGAAQITITLDDVADIDRPSLDVVRSLLSNAGRVGPIGVVAVTADNETETALGDVELRERVEVRALSKDGVRVWLRSIFQWEPPFEFVDWIAQQSGGLPRAIRDTLLQLIDRRLLSYDAARWMLADGFRGVLRPEPVLPRPKALRPPGRLLIGREGALRQLLRLLRTTRLVKLSGPGGIGKSRLALELAFEATDIFRDGVAWVAAPARGSPVELAAAVAQAFGLPELTGPDPAFGLAQHLRPRKALLVLDAFAGGPDSSDLLRTLLDLAPDLRILVTTRSRLHTRDEWIFHLEGLRTPKSLEAERVRGFSAVQLFLDRAALQPHAGIGDADLASVTRICQLLDGSPLAIELAAAQTALHSCREIANDLEISLETFASYLPSSPPEQQRILAVLEQVWRITPEEKRTLLRRAAIFDGEFDQPAAAAVLHAQQVDLDDLVRRALFVRVGERWTVHTTLREYLGNKLDEFANDRQELTAAFCTHYLEVASTLGDALRNPELLAEAQDRFAADFPNIRRAWTLAFAERRLDLIAESGGALFDFLRSRSPAEAEQWFRQAAHWLAATPAAAEHAQQLVQARLGAARAHTGLIDEARRHLSVALAAARRLRIPAEEVFCLRHIAWLEHAAGNTASASELARQAVLLARHTQRLSTLIDALTDAADLAAQAGAPEKAVEFLLEVIGLRGADTRKQGAWTQLLDIGAQLASQGNTRLAGALALQLLHDPDAPAPILARVEQQLAELRG